MSPLQPTPTPESMSATEAIIRRHALGAPLPGSRYRWVEPDIFLGHEATVALLLDRLEALGTGIKYPNRCLFAADHFVPPATAERAGILRRYLDFLKDNGLSLEHAFQGISHQILLEDSRLVPGSLVAGADSHTTMAGALGSVAIGFGSTDMLTAFAFGRLYLDVPPVVRLDLIGRMDTTYVGTRDLALAMMALFGQGGLAHRSLEVADLSDGGVDMATRASLANQGVDAGATSCLILPDDITAAFMAQRDGCGVEDVNRGGWVLPGTCPAYDDMHTYNLSGLGPLIARPPDPSDVVAVDAIEGVPIHQAFIGSCAGGRLEDLREAADVLKGRRLAPGVRAVVTPASRSVYLAALREGIVETLVQAGAQVTDSSCGACGGIDKGLLGPGEVGISTSNRNFRGRMGSPEAQVYLASARTAAASAVAGRIVHPGEVLG